MAKKFQRDDSDIFEVWFTWVKWAKVASQIGERPQDNVAFIESLMICKTSRDYYDGIAKYVGLNKKEEQPLPNNENSGSLEPTNTEPDGL